eukprot:XP_003723724.1 PREDICTED: U11/U12 small nuclear ribonucleoprotein 48 kDa protein [Strongylocentrotus purpuratus]
MYLFIPLVGPSNKTFPRTMDRLDAEFSPDQRLAIYEKVREKSEGQSQADKLDLELTFDPEKKDNDDKKETTQTHAEALAEMRDYRRRRQSYRAKNVHITKRSKTDVMREIIESHMKFLEETQSPVKEEEEESRKNERTHSGSREASSSRDHTRDHHRRRRSRSRDQSSRRDDDRSRSTSRSRDGKSRRHKHRHHSKHKHKSKHRSPPSVENVE